MATTRKLILERAMKGLEGAADLKAVKLAVKEAMRELKAAHEAARNDMQAVEKRLDDGGL